MEKAKIRFEFASGKSYEGKEDEEDEIEKIEDSEETPDIKIDKKECLILLLNSMASCEKFRLKEFFVITFRIFYDFSYKQILSLKDKFIKQLWDDARNSWEEIIEITETNFDRDIEPFYSREICPHIEKPFSHFLGEKDPEQDLQDCYHSGWIKLRKNF
jgi:hypothetical protein